MTDARRRQIELERINKVDSWRQTRLICWFNICDKLKDKTLTIHTFMPLPDDPTKEELKLQADKQHEDDTKWQLSEIEKWRKIRNPTYGNSN